MEVFDRSISRVIMVIVIVPVLAAVRTAKHGPEGTGAGT